MVTYLKHVGNFKHSELKSKKFEDIQAMYEKIKMSDEDFIAIGSVEDESLIKRMNKKDSSKGEKIKQESKEEVKQEDKEEENTRKRKQGRMRAEIVLDNSSDETRYAEVMTHDKENVDVEKQPLQVADLPTQVSTVERDPKPIRSKKSKPDPDPNHIRIFHENRSISKRIFIYKMKNYKFDEHGSGSTLDKAFDDE
ncbi:hypothetical protein Tco_0574411 [Tanacetum coccineum]